MPENFGDAKRARRRKVIYSLTDQGLAAEPGPTIPLADILEVRTYDIPVWRFAGRVLGARRQRCVVRPRRGSALLIGAEDSLRLAGGDDDAPYDAFVKALLRRVALVNPKAVLAQGMPAVLWWLWMALLLGCLIVVALSIAVLATNVENGMMASKESLGVFVFLIAIMFLIVPVARLLPFSRPTPIDPRKL